MKMKHKYTNTNPFCSIKDKKYTDQYIHKKKTTKIFVPIHTIQIEHVYINGHYTE